MMHTFLGTDQEDVKKKVRAPFIEYLRTSMALWQSGSEDIRNLTPERAGEVLSLAFERYYQTSGLFGTPETCLETIQKLKQVGVDEIACLIDFGVETEDVLKGLHALHWLQEKTRGLNAQASRRAAACAENGFHSVASMAVPELVESGSCLNQIKFTSSQPGELLSRNRMLLELVQQAVTDIISRVTQLRPEAITAGNHFLTLGINSLKGAEILNEIQKQFDLKLSHSLLFEFPTAERLSEMLVREYKDHLIGHLPGRADQDKVTVQDLRAPEKSFVAEGSPSA